MNNQIIFIGEITTPYNTIEECPNNVTAQGIECQITVYNEYLMGLKGLCKGDKILILYWLDGANREVTVARSAHDGTMSGTFAMRTPHRPNPIGAAVLEIESISNGVICIKGLDCLNGTKLVDIKPAIMAER